MSAEKSFSERTPLINIQEHRKQLKRHLSLLGETHRESVVKILNNYPSVLSGMETKELELTMECLCQFLIIQKDTEQTDIKMLLQSTFTSKAYLNLSLAQKIKLLTILDSKDQTLSSIANHYHCNNISFFEGLVYQAAIPDEELVNYFRESWPKLLV